MSRMFTNLILPLVLVAPVALTGCPNDKEGSATAGKDANAKPDLKPADPKPAEPGPKADADPKPQDAAAGDEAAGDPKAVDGEDHGTPGDAGPDAKADAGADAGPDADADAK